MATALSPTSSARGDTRRIQRCCTVFTSRPPSRKARAFTRTRPQPVRLSHLSLAPGWWRPPPRINRESPKISGRHDQPPRRVPAGLNEEECDGNQGIRPPVHRVTEVRGVGGLLGRPRPPGRGQVGRRRSSSLPPGEPGAPGRSRRSGRRTRPEPPSRHDRPRGDDAPARRRPRSGGDRNPPGGHPLGHALDPPHRPRRPHVLPGVPQGLTPPATPRRRVPDRAPPRTGVRFPQYPGERTPVASEIGTRRSRAPTSTNRRTARPVAANRVFTAVSTCRPQQVAPPGPGADAGGSEWAVHRPRRDQPPGTRRIAPG